MLVFLPVLDTASTDPPTLVCVALTVMVPVTWASPSRWAVVVPLSTETAIAIATLPSSPAQASALTLSSLTVTALMSRFPASVSLAVGPSVTCEDELTTITAAAIAIPFTAFGAAAAEMVFVTSVPSETSPLAITLPRMSTVAVLLTMANAAPTRKATVGETSTVESALA